MSIVPFNLGAVKTPRPNGEVDAQLASVRHRAWRTNSPSQVGTYDDCERKWWFRSIAVIPEEKANSLLLGGRVDEILKDMLITGQIPVGSTDPFESRAQEVALVGFRAVQSSGRWNGPIAKERLSVRYALYHDAWPVPMVVEIDWVEAAEILTDIKTSSMKLSMTPEKLAVDAQSVLYTGAWAGTDAPLLPPIVLGFERDRVYKARRLGDGTGLRFGHLHLTTKAPYKAASVDVLFEGDMHAAGVDRISEIARRQAVAAQIVQPRDTTPNSKACYAHGPCPFLDHCKYLGDLDMLKLPSALKAPSRLDAMNAACREEMAAPPEPAALPLEQPPAPATPPLALVQLQAQRAKAEHGRSNHNAARGLVATADYSHAGRPNMSQVEKALVDTFGPYRTADECTYALREHKKMETPPGTRKPEEWAQWFRGVMAEGAAPPSVDAVARAMEGQLEPVPVPEPEPEVDRGNDEAPPEVDRAKATRPTATKKKESIPAHPLIRVGLHGLQRQSIQADMAGRIRNELAAVARQQGHMQIPTGAPSSLRKDLLQEIAVIIHAITGILPWGDEAAPLPPGKPEATKPEREPNQHSEAIDDLRMEIRACFAEGMSVDATVADLSAKFERITSEAIRAWTESIYKKLKAEHAPAEPIHTATATVANDPPAETPAPAETTPPEPVSSPAPSVQHGARLLFIDCSPRDGGYVELIEFMEPLYRWVEEQRKVEHFLALPYGDGPKIAAAGLHHALKQGKLALPTRLVVRRSAPGSAEALSVLMPLYDRGATIEATR